MADNKPQFSPPSSRVAEPVREPPKPEPTPYVAGDIAFYELINYMQFPGESHPRAPGSIMGCVQCDSAVDLLWLVEGIRKGILKRKE